MTKPTSPQNSNDLDTDLLVTTAGTTGYLKLALLGSAVTPTGSDYLAAVQLVAQNANTTATLANVAGSASSVTLLAANTARRGATIYNDSTAILYIKFGSTASSTSFVYKAMPEDYYEVPFGYSGIITGIWASATGAARITEVTI